MQGEANEEGCPYGSKQGTVDERSYARLRRKEAQQAQRGGGVERACTRGRRLGMTLLYTASALRASNGHWDAILRYWVLSQKLVPGADSVNGRPKGTLSLPFPLSDPGGGRRTEKLAPPHMCAAPILAPPETAHA